MKALRRLTQMTTVAAIFCAGCAPPPQAWEQDEEKNPYYVSGKQKLLAKDYRGALADFERAVDIQPRNALAHFELGRLYHGEELGLQDYASAIYHYRRFRALRPQSQRAELAEGFIRDALWRLAASVPHSNVLPPQEIARLQGENAALRRENEDLRARLESVQARAAAAPAPVVLPAPPPALPAEPMATAPAPAAHPAVGTLPPATPKPSSPPARKYVVQKGDTLSSIAARFYGSAAAANRIYEANRDKMKDKNTLSVGQVLILPSP